MRATAVTAEHSTAHAVIRFVKDAHSMFDANIKLWSNLRLVDADVGRCLACPNSCRLPKGKSPNLARASHNWPKYAHGNCVDNCSHIAPVHQVP
jgi:hypothetical protein